MKIRKTETNIKRIERLKKTIAFILFQVILVSLFCIFGVVGTASATENNTTTVVATIEDYSYRKLRWGNCRYNIYVGSEKYRTTSNFLTVNNEQFKEVLNKAPTVSVCYDRVGRVVQMCSDGVEYVSFDKYNSEQMTGRILAIVLFLLVELFLCAEYVIYIIFHRTSKDKKWI